MTRAGLLFGFALGLVSLAGGVLGYVQAGSTVSLVAGALSGVVVLVAAGLAARKKSAVAQAIMCGMALLLLARFLPVYFRTYRVWPALVVVGLATLCFGFGLLGFVLDRYRPSVGQGHGSG